MQRPKVLNALVPKAKDFVQPMWKFYIRHESSVLTAGTIGFSLATTAVTLRNARFIMNTIDDAHVMLENAKTNDKKEKIFVVTVKELAPKAIPIIVFQSLTILCAIRSKKESDKKIAELTEALAMANNAITSYKAFEKEAKEKLGDEKYAEVKDVVAKEVLEEHPEKPINDISNTPSGNEVFEYWDNFTNRRFYSTVSPSEMRMRIHNLSLRFTKGEINNYDDEGRSKVTYNDIYELFKDDALVVHPVGDTWGWYDTDAPYRDADEDAITVWISPTEDPNNPDHTVWFFDMEGGPFFRKDR